MKPHRCCTHRRGEDVLMGILIAFLFVGAVVMGCVGAPSW
jgi:uncharacterized membrane protein